MTFLSPFYFPEPPFTSLSPRLTLFKPPVTSLMPKFLLQGLVNLGPREDNCHFNLLRVQYVRRYCLSAPNPAPWYSWNSNCIYTTLKKPDLQRINESKKNLHQCKKSNKCVLRNEYKREHLARPSFFSHLLSFWQYLNYYSADFAKQLFFSICSS